MNSRYMLAEPENRNRLSFLDFFKPFFLLVQGNKSTSVQNIRQLPSPCKRRCLASSSSRSWRHFSAKLSLERIGASLRIAHILSRETSSSSTMVKRRMKMREKQYNIHHWRGRRTWFRD